MSARVLAAVLALLALAPLTPAQLLPTPAEKSGYQQTARHAEVVAFGEALAKQSPLVRATDFGTSHEGRTLPLLILSDPAVGTPEEAAKSGKPVVLAFANIHAGEVDGKDALLALARDLASEKDLLKKLVVLLVPNLNPDGNEKIDVAHRSSQAGPAGGVGVRENAQGFDLNRDFVKLESPEVRALVRLVDQWKPLLVVDCHTTNGSYHRFTLTYDGPRHPAADSHLIEFAQGKLLPDLAARVKRATGFDSFPYGNFSRDRGQWVSYEGQPRFGVQYLALRGCVGLLSESYTYAPFPDRVKASYTFVKAAFGYAADHPAELKALAADAAKPRPRVALRTKMVAEEKVSTVLGYVEENRKRTEKPKEYPVHVVDKLQPTLEAEVPAGYLIPAGYPAAVEALQRHGVKVEELLEDLPVEAQAYTVTGFEQAARAFQKHNLVSFEVASQKVRTTAPAGGVLVRTAQPLGQLAAYLLEPQAEDGLAAWNFFDANLVPGKRFPVLRLPSVPAILTGPAAPLPEDKPKKKPITLEMLLGGGGFGGGGGGGRFGGGTIDWLDGEHFLQSRQGRMTKVNARTGDAKPFLDPDKLKDSLKALKDLSPTAADQLVRSPFLRMTKDRTAALVDVGPDVAVAYFDGKPAIRLTKSGAGKELLSLSPDGKRVAFVRGGNLFAADAEQGEVQFTKDGGGEVLNGKADWVYYEEIFNRNYKAYWWSPDGSALAFMRFDDAPVAKFTVTAAFPNRGQAEATAYPKTGDPNPTVKLGVVPATGGDVVYLDLTGYPPEKTVFARVGWVPGTKTPFAYVQNREQTWLDFVTWPDWKGSPVKLFRETTKAWVEDLGEPTFLKDGTFLIHSERSGWKHLYHYAANGKLLRPVTSGEWEAQSIDRVDEAGGWVYFTGTKDNPTGTHFYRVKLAGGEVERLTEPGGTHRASIAPTGGLYVDRFSDDNVPQQTALFDLGKGKVRTLDTGTAPGRDREQYSYGKYERVKVPMADGFVLEGALIYPPDFDESKTYPVWVMTYAGPHAPTVRTGYSPRVSMEQVLANSGIVVFRVDPRSASGKGAASAWTCFRQLGVQELKDLEEAVDWVCRNPWADAKRIGISGHSYGGYMTAYALTHSKKFAAGIAGAPVTDWRLYDTIYTERYMGLPSENKEGYDKSSVVRAAANLHGKLLIVHGMIDDNVHMQNSAQFIDALQRANKDFEIMVYPRSRHGIGGPHYIRLEVNFIRRAMGVSSEEKK